MITLILIFTLINTLLFLNMYRNTRKIKKRIWVKNDELLEASNKRRASISQDISAINYNYLKVLSFFEEQWNVKNADEKNDSNSPLIQ